MKLGAYVPQQPLGSVFALPREVTRLEDCFFYHTIDVPGYGTVPGPWDLRGCVDDYLGGVDLAGKRVLECGTASGFLCMEMEKRGAEVVAFDLSEDFDQDLVPYARGNEPEPRAHVKQFVRTLNNGWWLVHRANNASARVVYGEIYNIPVEIGEVDVVTYGSILLHVRDPYQALASGCRLARDTVIVTEHPVHWGRFPAPPLAVPIPQAPGEAVDEAGWREREEQLRERVRVAETTLQSLLDAPIGLFLPHASTPNQNFTWWCLNPQTLCAMLGTLGFPNTTVAYHDTSVFNGKPERLFTVVGRRS